MTDAETTTSMYDPDSRCFRPGTLHQAIAVRGWSVADFARTARLSRTHIYAINAGGKVQAETLGKLADTLSRRQPVNMPAF